MGLALMIAPVTGIAQQKTLKEQIIGSWASAFVEHTYPDGRKVQEFGANPKGISVFDGNGRFIVIVLHSDLPKLASNDWFKPSPDEAMTIAKGVIANYGSYTVNEADQSLSLNLEGSYFANQCFPQKRIVMEINADEMKLQNPSSIVGGIIEHIVTRIK